MKSNLDLAKALLAKAENDLKTAGIGLEHAAPLDTVAFHLQQAAEKMLKAVLASRAILYPKTHDLDDLMDLIPQELSEIHSFRERLQGWNSYAVEMRYEITVYPEQEEVQEALKTAGDLHAAVLKVVPFVQTEKPKDVT